MKILIICLALVFGGCATGQSSVSETQVNEARVYREKCGKCHLAHNPEIMTYEHWERIVEHMGDKRSTPLTQEEKKILLDYLRENAKH